MPASILDAILAVLRIAWPFVLAAAIWGWQETRVVAAHLQTSAAQSRAVKAETLLADARKRATDLALLWAGELEKADAGRRELEAKDNETIDALRKRVAALSPRPSLHFSADALRVWNDAVRFANADAAATPATPAGRADPVPADAAVGADVSEQADADWKVKAGEAYRDAVRLFHECRDAYNAMRSKQQEGLKP